MHHRNVKQGVAQWRRCGVVSGMNVDGVVLKDMFNLFIDELIPKTVEMEIIEEEGCGVAVNGGGDGGDVGRVVGRFDSGGDGGVGRAVCRW
jgi:hypothetical protein